jgi:hypothetical protein
MTRLTLKQLKEEIEGLKKEIANLKRKIPYSERWPKPKSDVCPCCGKVKREPYPYNPYDHVRYCVGGEL